MARENPAVVTLLGGFARQGTYDISFVKGTGPTYRIVWNTISEEDVELTVSRVGGDVAPTEFQWRVDRCSWLLSLGSLIEVLRSSRSGATGPVDLEQALSSWRLNYRVMRIVPINDAALAVR